MGQWTRPPRLVECWRWHWRPRDCRRNIRRAEFWSVVVGVAMVVNCRYCHCHCPITKIALLLRLVAPDRFPNSITSCCEALYEGGCDLSGIVQYLPDWANGHCYEKDTNLIEEWEWRWSHETLESCCDRCKSCFVWNFL